MNFNVQISLCLLLVYEFDITVHHKMIMAYMHEQMKLKAKFDSSISIIVDKMHCKNRGFSL